MGKTEIRIFNNSEDLSVNAAELIYRLSKLYQKTKGRFTISLSGGETPKAVYSRLGEEPFKSGILWERTFLFWGDERCLSTTGIKTNFEMVYKTLLSKIPIPFSNIFRIRTELGADRAAREYENTIKNMLGETPVFDLILLGVGSDGHTASLFPASGALLENKKLAVASYVEKLKADRVTLTLPVFNNAENIVFLVTGKGKAEIVKTLLDSGDNTGDSLPVQFIKPRRGNCLWFLDKEAASLLSAETIKSLSYRTAET